MELNQELLNELKAESAELVERFARIWMGINATVEQGHKLSRGEIDELFRTLHSLKSLSEIADKSRLVSALHLIEDRLAAVREGTSTLSLKDLEHLAEVQLILEKIFVSGFDLENDSLLSELEFRSQMFCIGEQQEESPSAKIQQNTTTGEASLVTSLSDKEREGWDKYTNRDEYLFAVVGDGSAEVCRAKIDPIGDIIIARTSGQQFLFVFAAELDQSLVEAVVEAPVKLIQKDIRSLTSLGPPWTLLDEQVRPVEAPVFHEPAFHEPAEVQSESADPEMVRDFLSNGGELLETLTQSLLELESNPSDLPTVENIFRAAHTIKGTAGMLGFTVVEKLCHALENTFDRIRKGQLSASPLLVDQLLVGWDKVRELFALLEQGNKPELPIEEYLRQLVAAENGEQLNVTAKPQVAQAPASAEQAPAATSTKSNESQATLRVDLKRLDNLVNLVGELVIDRTRFARIEEAMRTRGASADLSHQMAESLLLFGRHMNEVQNIIMKVRMVPVGNVFYKFSRMVRDLSRQIGKEVELQIVGGDTELDKTLVEEIGDPLVHLIRNSVDHGIESPQERESKGKSPKGLIRISAAQQGNMIVISVEDDGKGLDVERIRAKAIKNGLIKENEHIATKDIFNLIFEPGFSTAEKVTNISGRGVGMDVVKKNIQKLKGVIDLDSTQGQGTKIIIKLPITLAIVPSLMVEVSGENFAIPLVNVIESIRVDPSEIQLMGTSQFVRLREQVVPIVKFSDFLGLNRINTDFWYRESTKTSTLQRRRERMVFVVIGVGPERLGLVVDRLIGQQEIVIKPLGRLLKNQSGLAGGCVLGDGRVALVLDVLDVIGKDAGQRGSHDRRAS